MIIITALKMLIAILLGVIYLPLNMLNNWLAAQMIKSWKGDKILFFLYGIVFLPTWALAAIFSIPYEKLVESAH